MIKTIPDLLAAKVLDEFDWIARRSIIVQQGLNAFKEQALTREDFGTADMCETARKYAGSAVGRAHFHRRFEFMERMSAAQEAMIREGHKWNGATEYAAIRADDLSECQRILDECERQLQSLGGTMPTAETVLAAILA